MHFNNINTLRFLGAFFVLFGHTFALCYGPGNGEDPLSEWLKTVTAYHAMLPGIGVALFFVLSGYLVTRSYENRHNFFAYIEARALRIFPALWVTLLLTVFVLGPLVSSLEASAYFSHHGTWNYVFHNARLFPDVIHRLPGVFLDNPRAGGVNGSLWTLPVEVRMYAIVAALGVLGVLRRRLFFNLVAVCLIAWFVIAPDHFFLFQKLKHERLGLYFLLGALFYMNRDKVKYNWVGVVVLSILMVLNFKNAIYNLVYATWFAYLVLYISFHPRIKLPDFGKYGDFSYGLYLYAFPMTQVAILLLGPENPWLIVLCSFSAAMVLALFSWFVVEKPAMQMKGRIVGAWPEKLKSKLKAA